MMPSLPAGSQRELLSLPTEILLALAGFLPPPSLCALSQTCTAAYELLSDDEAWSAWQGSYLVTFDDPRESGWKVEKGASGKGGRDWRFLAQQCFKAVRLLVGEQLDCETEMVSFHALVHLLHTAPPAPLPSRNLKLLKGALLPSLLTFTRNHPARPLLSKLILHQDHLANWASWEYGERELGAWREIVYDVTTYADQPNFGPFQTYFAFGQGGLKVRGADWTVVNAIAQCMGDNLRRSAENGDWEGEYEDVPLTRELARPNSGRKKEGGDWAGLGGVWTGGYAFVDYADWVGFNYPRLTRRISRMSLEGYEEIVGNTMSLVLACDSEAGSSKVDDHGRLRPYTFSGASHNPLVGASTVSGIVTPLYPSPDPTSSSHFIGPPMETRVTFAISYGGQERWALEGIMLEGGRGIVGVWTEVNRERRSPCGPFWYFRAGEGERAEDEQGQSDLSP